MPGLVFLSGDFSSGSTLLFTLFRATRKYHCLYEPLHPRLREYLIWPVRTYQRHYFVKDYFKEYKDFDRINELFNPEWATRDLYLTADDQAEDLYRYISYLIETASSRQDKVLLKFNRITFRLPWIRARFPQAKIVHIYRDKESQWKSIVARVQENLGRDDVGQNRPDFEGFDLAAWCEDLKTVFPELAAEYSQTGFERFCKLYDRSLAAHRADADISIEYRSLCEEFETQCRRMFDVAGCTADVGRLKPLIVPPEDQRRPLVRPTGLAAKASALIEQLGRRYAARKVHQTERQRQKRSAFG